MVIQAKEIWLGLALDNINIRLSVKSDAQVVTLEV